MVCRGESWRWLLGVMLFGLFLPGMAWTQSVETGLLKYPLAANGFKNLKLGEFTKLIPVYRLVYMDGNDMPDADSCYRYIYNDNNILGLADDITLNKVGFRTYKNQIIEIYLFFRHVDGYKVLKDFVANYGTWNNRPTDFTYIWENGDVSLSLCYKDDLELGVVIFSSKKMRQLVQQYAIRVAATQKAIATSLSIAGIRLFTYSSPQ
jgi:hypothetical protein